MSNLVKENNEVKTTVVDSERRKMIQDIAKKMDITKSDDVLTFGLDAQKKVSDFSDSTLKKIKTKDLDETGKMVTELLTEIKKVDIDLKPGKGIIGWIKNKKFSLELMKSQYESVSKNIDTVVNKLQNQRVELMEDINMLDDLYAINEEYFKEISLYIEVGNEKIAQMKEGPLKELAIKAQETGDPGDIQKMKDMDNLITRFQQKIYDLSTTRMISIQMAPQIRLIQNANVTMVDKLESTVNNTIPIWKSQMLIKIGTIHTKEATELVNKSNDITNQMMITNSEALKQAIIETSRESQRPVIDIDTIKVTNQNLVDTIKEVQAIQEQGRKNREDATEELKRLEKEMARQLFELTQKEVQERISRLSDNEMNTLQSKLNGNNISELASGINLESEIKKLKEKDELTVKEDNETNITW